MEYFYSKSAHRWCILSTGYNTAYVSDEKADELRNARKNKKFAIVKSRYNLVSDYIYIDIDDFKLILTDTSGKLFYFVIKDRFCTSRSIFSSEEVKNIKDLISHGEDVKYANDYVGTNSTIRLKSRFPLNENERKEVKHWREVSINQLSPAARLYYEMNSFGENN